MKKSRRRLFHLLQIRVITKNVMDDHLHRQYLHCQIVHIFITIPRENGTDHGQESKKKKFLYITFDDGPNFGSHVVLDAFKAAGKRT